MRLLAILCLCLLPARFAAAPSPPVPSGPGLKQLYDQHQWFALRRATANGSGPALYRGAVASAFGEQDKAEALLRGVIAADNHSDDAYQAHEWLTYLYMRDGLYREVVAETHAKVLARPDKDSAGERSLMKAFSAFPDQSVASRHPARIPFSVAHNDMVIPVSIGGRAVHFILDSDANVSVISPAQARALGLAVQSADAKAFGAAGGGVSFSVAVAPELTIGATHLRNVAFEVYPDDSELFKDLPLGSRGLIGLPVLRALGRLAWSMSNQHDGFLDITPSQTTVDKDPNLCFDGGDPLTEITYSGQAIPVVLDTGNEATQLWPPFAEKFSSTVNEGKKRSQQVTGFDGSAALRSVELPRLTFALGGADVTLAPAPVLLEATTPNSKWYYGRIGIDLLLRRGKAAWTFAR